jgi:DNA-binding beta-propeller fold protein YncE
MNTDLQAQHQNLQKEDPDHVSQENGQELSSALSQESGTKKWVFLILLVVLLSSCLFFFIKYLRSPAPLPELVVPQLNLNYAPHYLFSIYGVNTPIGIALSPQADRIYVSESGGERLIHIFDRQGNHLSSFAPPDTNPGERAPVYLAADSTGRLFVSDRAQHAIFIYDAEGNYQDTIVAPDLSLREYLNTAVGALEDGDTFSYNIYRPNIAFQRSDGSELEIDFPITSGWAPLGIRIDQNERLIVTDVMVDQNRVIIFNLPAEGFLLDWKNLNAYAMSFGASGKGAGQFTFPNASAVDQLGRIFVSDGNNGRVSVWDDQGKFLFHLGEGTSSENTNLPRGLYIDMQGRLFVVDAVGQDVKVYNTANEYPEIMYSFGSMGMDDGMFNFPNDIAADASGRLYIVDRENHRVQVWSY